jgi:hypothetical protein
MVKLSKTQLISIWIINLNSIAINSIIMLKEIKLNKNIKFVREKSQMEKVLENSSIKVAIYKNTAYWVVNNIIYKAKIDEYGNVMDHEAEQIDVFKLSEKEVNNLLVILDSINS